MARLAWPCAVVACAAAVMLSIGMSAGGRTTSTAAAVPFKPAAVPPLAFTPPVPGSYQLERIMPAPDGNVLDSDGSSHRLHEFTTGKITLFSFIYTYCTDAKGCPLAYATLHTVRDMVAAEPALQDQVRLVSMSFDPAFDTPVIMRSYGGEDARAADAVPWSFLTTASTTQLAPVLDGFGQDVSVLAPAQPGARQPVLAHLLKVFLVDQEGMVREIYATDYLHPHILRNDIVTLLQERRASRAGTTTRRNTFAD